MEYYIVLTAATAIILVLAMFVSRKTKSIGFICGIGFLYYWSLYGAWGIISQRLGGGQERSYNYLYYKVFPIDLDEYYFWTIIFYSVFIVFVEATVLYFAKPKSQAQGSPPPRIKISHYKILLVSAIAGVISYLFIKDMLATARDLNTSVHYLNPDTSRFYTLYQFFDRLAIVPLSLGLAVFFSGKDARYIVGKRTPGLLIGYVVMFLVIFAFNLVLGSRNTLLFALVSMGLLYMANALRPKKLLLICGAVLGLAGVLTVGVLRDSFKSRELADKSWGEKFAYVISDLASSNESVAAHLSMYGALRKDIPLTYGSSFVWLITSAVPSAVRAYRPQEVYEYYADSVGAIPGQGYTIHHATGWYLNFGVLGLIAGAIIFGWIWSTLYNRLEEIRRPRSHVNRVFTVVSFFVFTANIPILVRDGPEAYKAVLVETFLIPTLILYMASTRIVRKVNHLALVPVAAAKYSAF
jgi:oligosaccharide repeat unit polymerase